MSLNVLTAAQPITALLPFLCLQLTAFSFRDYVRFGYVDQGDAHNAALLRRFNVDSYAPSMLLFKEAPLQPADAIQVGV